MLNHCAASKINKAPLECNKLSSLITEPCTPRAYIVSKNYNYLIFYKKNVKKTGKGYDAFKEGKNALNLIKKAELSLHSCT